MTQAEPIKLCSRAGGGGAKFTNFRAKPGVLTIEYAEIGF